eukprot:m.66144 g.66144  ORF g.66144 m.66144 type:complete len:243 (-) comp11784_c0_seq2:1886-2614(-)
MMFVFSISCVVIGAPPQWKVLNNTDFFNHNLPGAPTYRGSSVEDCANRCAQIPDCVAVSWNGPLSSYHDNNCNFKCGTGLPPYDHDKGEQAVVVRPGQNTCKTPGPPAPPAPIPISWHHQYDLGNLLYSSQSDKEAAIGNGYFSFLVGAGLEHIAGVFNGMLSYKQHTTSVRADIPSPLTDIRVLINGSELDKSRLPAALVLSNNAYLALYPLETDNDTNVFTGCVLQMYAHRAENIFLLST